MIQVSQILRQFKTKRLALGAEHSPATSPNFRTILQGYHKADLRVKVTLFHALNFIPQLLQKSRASLP